MVRILIKEMEEYAKKEKIPIMLPDGIAYLEQYLKEHNIKKILEIGTAIGYSAIRMANVNEEIEITSIERDQNRYQKAIQNIEAAGYQKRIHVKLCDALEFETEEQFDLIFIDAAKSQYIKFFEKFDQNLKQGGTIVSDNLDFHGFTKMETRIESKNLRQMVNKIRNYIEYLKNNKNYQTTFLEIGDGIGISVKQ